MNTAPGPTLSDERRSFEAWHSVKHGRTYSAWFEEKGHYVWNLTQELWLVWQARALLASARAPSGAPMQEGAARDVLAERERQKSAEGWTPEHDDEHADGSLALAAACYAAHSATWAAIEQGFDTERGIHTKHVTATNFVGRMWPWAREWWKPKDPRRNLVRAGALILAEIERLDRAAMKEQPQ